MTAPYYQDAEVTLYHGDCHQLTEWLAADVLVTDPPYGRAWKQGETNARRGWASNRHPGIAGDQDTTSRDDVLRMWGASRPAVVFGDLLLAPTGARLALIYDKGPAAGFGGAIGGFRRNTEGIYLLGAGWTTGLGGSSSILSRRDLSPNIGRATGHPHTKPLDVMESLIAHCPPGRVADPFAGSGTTLVAARALGRRAIGVELEERYCEVAARRLSQGVLDFGDAS